MQTKPGNSLKKNLQFAVLTFSAGNGIALVISIASPVFSSIWA